MSGLKLCQTPFWHAGNHGVTRQFVQGCLNITVASCKLHCRPSTIQFGSLLLVVICHQSKRSFLNSLYSTSTSGWLLGSTQSVCMACAAIMQPLHVAAASAQLLFSGNVVRMHSYVLTFVLPF